MFTAIVLDACLLYVFFAKHVSLRRNRSAAS
jgi:hypothetical protein